jgi:hypothetical protein
MNEGIGTVDVKSEIAKIDKQADSKTSQRSRLLPLVREVCEINGWTNGGSGGGSVGRGVQKEEEESLLLQYPCSRSSSGKDNGKSSGCGVAATFRPYIQLLRKCVPWFGN